MSKKKRTSAISSGFTLIELMVVIALVAIVSAMILPEMRGTYEDALLRSTSRQLVNAFDLAYSRAVSLDQTIRLSLDERSGKFFLEQRAGIGQHGPEFSKVRDLAGSEGELDSRITVKIRKPGEEPSGENDSQAPTLATSESRRADPTEGINFYPDGTADASEIQLRDRDGFRVSLKLNPVTARVHITELGRE